MRLRSERQQLSALAKVDCWRKAPSAECLPTQLDIPMDMQFRNISGGVHGS